jgi:hypothetical protein
MIWLANGTKSQIRLKEYGTQKIADRGRGRGNPPVTSAVGGKTGKHLLDLSLSGFDPERTIGCQFCCAAQRGVGLLTM